MDSGLISSPSISLDNTQLLSAFDHAFQSTGADETLQDLAPPLRTYFFYYHASFKSSTLTISFEKLVFLLVNAVIVDPDHVSPFQDAVKNFVLKRTTPIIEDTAIFLDFTAFLDTFAFIAFLMSSHQENISSPGISTSLLPEAMEDLKDTIIDRIFKPQSPPTSPSVKSAHTPMISFHTPGMEPYKPVSSSPEDSCTKISNTIQKSAQTLWHTPHQTFSPVPIELEVTQSSSTGSPSYSTDKNSPPFPSRNLVDEQSFTSSVNPNSPASSPIQSLQPTQNDTSSPNQRNCFSVCEPANHSEFTNPCSSNVAQVSGTAEAPHFSLDALDVTDIPSSDRGSGAGYSSQATPIIEKDESCMPSNPSTLIQPSDFIFADTIDANQHTSTENLENGTDLTISKFGRPPDFHIEPVGSNAPVENDDSFNLTAAVDEECIEGHDFNKRVDSVPSCNDLPRFSILSGTLSENGSYSTLPDAKIHPRSILKDGAIGWCGEAANLSTSLNDESHEYVSNEFSSNSVVDSSPRLAVSCDEVPRDDLSSRANDTLLADNGDNATDFQIADPQAKIISSSNLGTETRKFTSHGNQTNISSLSHQPPLDSEICNPFDPTPPSPNACDNNVLTLSEKSTIDDRVDESRGHDNLIACSHNRVQHPVENCAYGSRLTPAQSAHQSASETVQSPSIFEPSFAPKDLEGNADFSGIVIDQLMEPYRDYSTSQIGTSESACVSLQKNHDHGGEQNNRIPNHDIQNGQKKEYTGLRCIYPTPSIGDMEACTQANDVIDCPTLCEAKVSSSSPIAALHGTTSAILPTCDAAGTTTVGTVLETPRSAPENLSSSDDGERPSPNSFELIGQCSENSADLTGRTLGFEYGSDDETDKSDFINDEVRNHMRSADRHHEDSVEATSGFSDMERLSSRNSRNVTNTIGRVFNTSFLEDSSEFGEEEDSDTSLKKNSIEYDIPTNRSGDVIIKTVASKASTKSHDVLQSVCGLHVAEEGLLDASSGDWNTSRRSTDANFTASNTITNRAMENDKFESNNHALGMQYKIDEGVKPDTVKQIYESVSSKDIVTHLISHESKEVLPAEEFSPLVVERKVSNGQSVLGLDDEKENALTSNNNIHGSLSIDKLEDADGGDFGDTAEFSPLNIEDVDNMSTSSDLSPEAFLMVRKQRGSILIDEDSESVHASSVDGLRCSPGFSSLGKRFTRYGETVFGSDVSFTETKEKRVKEIIDRELSEGELDLNSKDKSGILVLSKDKNNRESLVIDTDKPVSKGGTKRRQFRSKKGFKKRIMFLRSTDAEGSSNNRFVTLLNISLGIIFVVSLVVVVILSVGQVSLYRIDGARFAAVRV